MQLLQLLTEQAARQQEVVELVSQIRQSKQFFDARGSDSSLWFWRGIKYNEVPLTMSQASTPRTDRRPADTSPKLHEMLDSRLLRDFGIKYRSAATFVTGDHTTAKDFGSLCIILPLSNYELVYGENCLDAYGVFRGHDLKAYIIERSQSTQLSLDGLPSEVSTRAGEADLMLWVQSRPTAMKLAEQWFDDRYASCQYKKGNTTEAIRSGREIMLHTPEIAIIPYRKNIHPDIISVVERVLNTRLNLDMDGGTPSTDQLINVMLPHIFK